MRRMSRLLPVLGLVAVLLASCSKNGKVIPRSRMMDIYYDMFLADQWLGDHYEARKTADTTLFYEPIFEKYGYTFKDFDHSVSYYLKDPDKYAKMLKTVSRRLGEKAKELEKVKQAIEEYREPAGYVPVSFDRDSLGHLLWPAVLDSLAVSDSLAVPDSLAVRDTVAAVLPAAPDSLVLLDSVAAGEVVKDSVRALIRDDIDLKLFNNQ